MSEGLDFEVNLTPGPYYFHKGGKMSLDFARSEGPYFEKFAKGLNYSL